MLFLLFEIGSSRYCLDVSQVIEITPLVSLRKLPFAPPYVSGLMNYRGDITPVIDLSLLLGQEASRPLFSTRIVLVRFRASDKSDHMLGLMAEKATETISRREEDFKPMGLAIDNARFLGKVVSDERGMIQRLEMQQILPEDVQRTLFTESEAV
ncbi:MAG: purine-binding chemotaxis protein CheW [Desulfobacteraceae bacterium]|nr:MAG: purine-binding chemotaxis protein CheW [Desulfobacteraceae bacterium]